MLFAILEFDSRRDSF